MHVILVTYKEFILQLGWFKNGSLSETHDPGYPEGDTGSAITRSFCFVKGENLSRNISLLFDIQETLVEHPLVEISSS